MACEQSIEETVKRVLEIESIDPSDIVLSERGDWLIYVQRSQSTATGKKTSEIRKVHLRPDIDLNAAIQGDVLAYFEEGDVATGPQLQQGSLRCRRGTQEVSWLQISQDPTFFQAHGRDQLNLCIHDVVTGRTQDVAWDQGSASEFNPAIHGVSWDYVWSPTGRYVAFQAPTNLPSPLDFNKGNLVELSEGGIVRAAFAGANGIFVLDVETGKIARASPTEFSVASNAPPSLAWSPDEEFIACASAWPANGYTIVRSRIALVRWRERDVRLLVHRTGANFGVNRHAILTPSEG